MTACQCDELDSSICPIHHVGFHPIYGRKKSESQRVQSDDFKREFAVLYQHIAQQLPRNPYRSRALEALEMAAMWTTKGILAGEVKTDATEPAAAPPAPAAPKPVPVVGGTITSKTWAKPERDASGGPTTRRPVRTEE